MRRWTAGLAAACVLAALGVMAPGLGAQRGGQAAYRAPRTPDGKPDLQGLWEVHNRAWVDLEDHDARPGMVAGPGKPYPMTFGMPAGRGVVEGGAIPYQPAALAKRTENLANRFTADPVAHCFMPGVPRATTMGMAFQIFQTPTFVAITYEYAHTYRIIYTDGSPHVQGIDFWMGDSRGRWEGETLVVDVKGFNDKTWFDAAGNFHSDALHVVERYTRTSPDTVEYEATIEDPKVFTRPWKISMPVHRIDPRDYGDRLLEYECQVLAEVAAGTFVPGKR
jgi:hypothetical protein